MRRIVLIVGVILSALAFPSLRTSGTLHACEICKVYTFARIALCQPVKSGETGTTICKDEAFSSGGTWCSEGGDFCAVVDAGGGGGTGGGGGGGVCVMVGWFCPAECFACGGGGAV